jgi:CRISPR-associated protein Cas2
MIKNRFMRIIAIFDLPMITNEEKRNYRKFVKYLKNEGYIRIQYSVYSKLCINNNSCITAAKKLRSNAPKEGDVRYMVVSENQYLGIVNINNVYSLQEKITTMDRTIIIGGMNVED